MKDLPLCVNICICESERVTDGNWMEIVRAY